MTKLTREHLERNRLEIEIDIQSARIDRLKENAQTAKEREYAHVGAGLDKAIKRAEEDLNELKRQLAEVMK